MAIPHWTPKRRSRALGLIKGGRHSLLEITKITNIPKSMLQHLKHCNTPLNKARLGRPSSLLEQDKCRVVIHITKNH